MKNKSLLFLVLAAVAVAMLSAGCTAPEEPQDVEDLAQARWDALVERDFAAAWEFHAPGFRQTTPREDYIHDMRRRPILWLDAEVVGTDCDDLRCNVDLKVTYRAVAAPHGQSQMKMTREIEELWISLDGNWWFSPD